MKTPNRKSAAQSRAFNSRKADDESTGRIRSVGRAGIDLQPRRLLLAAARQSGIGDPDSCTIVLSLLSAGRSLRRALGRELGFQDNSGSRFAVLLTLYALDPLPATAADLAYHAEVIRSSISDAIETLEQRGLVAWVPGDRDRIMAVHLTELGRQAAMLAVHRFLRIASELAGGVSPTNRGATVETCRQVERAYTRSGRAGRAGSDAKTTAQ